MHCDFVSGEQSGTPIDVQVTSNPYEFTMPLSRVQEYASETTEDIETTYKYDGTSFILNMDTAFVPREAGPDVPYIETRVFTPVPIDGYRVIGISLNGVDLVMGEMGSIDEDLSELNVVAKYEAIPEIVQTGDLGDYWWLVGLAVLAMVGVAFGATRKQKGVRC